MSEFVLPVKLGTSEPRTQNVLFPRNSRYFVFRVATFKRVCVFNIAKMIFREMLTGFLYIVLIRKSRLIIHMQI